MERIDVGVGTGRTFNARLVAMIGLTLVAVALAQYAVGGRVFRDRVFHQALGGFEGDVQVLEGLWADRSAPWAAMNELVAHIAHRPGSVAAAIVDADGIVALSDHSGTTMAGHGDGAGHGEGGSHGHDGLDDHHHLLTVGTAISEPDAAILEQVLRTGEPFAGPEPDSEHGAAAYVIPLELDDTYALFVVTGLADLERQLSDLRTLLLLGLVLAGVIGAPTAYLLGGRRLARLHRHHVERARQDSLTGLGNHRAYQDDVREEVEVARRHDRPLTIALLDLDGFKLVNDTAGHRKGDEVLLKVAGILADGRRGDRAYRVGGDEFALLLPSTDLEAARSACERIRDQVAAGIPEIGVSVGLAELRQHADDVEALWECADAAMYRAKARGPNHVVAFAELDDGHPGVSLTKATGLRALLEEAVMDVAFQPVVALPGGEVIGYEALARPPAVAGFEGPTDAFVAAARLGKVAELDALCRAAALSAASDLPAGSRLFLNVAAESLTNDLLDWNRLHAEVAAAGMDARQVTIEVTGSSRVTSATLAAEAARAREAGFRIALDDAGADGTTFPALLALRPDTIKIDRSVVVGSLDDPGARGVLLAIVTYGSVAGAELVAEGVEDAETVAALLRSDGAAAITAAQGFLFGRPASVTPRPRQRQA